MQMAPGANRAASSNFSKDDQKVSFVADSMPNPCEPYQQIRSIQSSSGRIGPGGPITAYAKHLAASQTARLPRWGYHPSQPSQNPSYSPVSIDSLQWQEGGF